MSHTTVRGNKHGLAWPDARKTHKLNMYAGRREQLKEQRSTSTLGPVGGSELTFSTHQCASGFNTASYNESVAFCLCSYCNCG